MRTGPALLVALCSLVLLAGCWDVRDVNNMAFAVTMGIDLPNDPRTAKYKVTLEFPKPTAHHPTPQSLVASGDGNSVAQAIEQIQAGISRTISFSHLRVLIVGEAIARRESFNDISNFLMKEPEVALRLRLLFTKGYEAQKLFFVRPRYSGMLATELVAMFDTQEQFALVRTNHFFRFWSNLKRNHGVAMAQRLLLADSDKTMISEGAAIYKNWKLDSWLSGVETEGANWLLEQNQVIIVAKEGPNSYTYRVTKLKTTITPHLKAGKISFAVKVAINGMVIEEAGKAVDLSRDGNLKHLGKLFSRLIQRQIKAAVHKSQQELRSDYLGFGEVFKQNRPRDFERYDWERVYPSVPIDVEVTANVSSSGLQT